jgi:hypothetical protein
MLTNALPEQSSAGVPSAGPEIMVSAMIVALSLKYDHP